MKETLRDLYESARYYGVMRPVMTVQCEVPPGSNLSDDDEIARLLVPYRVEIDSFLCRGEEIVFTEPFILRIGRFHGGHFVAMDVSGALEIALAAPSAAGALIEALDEFYERWTDGPEENPVHRLHRFTSRKLADPEQRRPVFHHITGWAA